MQARERLFPLIYASDQKLRFFRTVSKRTSLSIPRLRASLSEILARSRYLPLSLANEWQNLFARDRRAWSEPGAQILQHEPHPPMDPPLPIRHRRPGLQNSNNELQSIGILEFLEKDPRPSFVLDKSESSRKSGNAASPLYWNQALDSAQSGTLLQTVFNPDCTDHNGDYMSMCPDFRLWMMELKTSDKPFIFRNYIWTRILVAGHWSVISGTLMESKAKNITPKTELNDMKTRTMSVTGNPTFDWTDDLPPVNMSSHVAWARSIDWSETSLGAMSQWSPQLRSMANLVMQDTRPAVVFFGPDLIMIYNEAEVELLGNFHPCMGLSARVALQSVWPQYFDPIIEKNLKGETVEKVNTAIQMVRNGFMEESYFSLQFIPIFDENGKTVGHYESLVETVSTFLREEYLQLMEEDSRGFIQ